MNITIDIHMIINGTRTLQSGVFQVNREVAIPSVAYNWIRSVRRQTGYYGDESVIEKVVWNADNNITDEVKKIDDAPIIGPHHL
jgi:hypothetical protein